MKIKNEKNPCRGRSEAYVIKHSRLNEELSPRSEVKQGSLSAKHLVEQDQINE